MTSEEALLGIIPGPVYTEKCGHGGYIATFECYPHGVFDLYVFHSPFYDQEVCLRFGEADNEYRSPGSISNVIRHAHVMEEYARVVDILMARGKIVWQARR
jgi:hypothetical protein